MNNGLTWKAVVGCLLQLPKNQRQNNMFAGGQLFSLTLWASLLSLQNGKWRWADESRYSYELWMPRKPSNRRNSELCVELWRWTGKEAK